MADNSIHSNTLTIGRLSSLAEVDVATVRFYERSGLVQAQERTSSGYRLYSRNSLARILLIRRAREMGYSLQQIKEILNLHDNGGQKNEVKTVTHNMVDNIDSKILALKKWRQLFVEVSDYFEQMDADTIDGITVDAMMRRHCADEETDNNSKKRYA
jgi:DNA-binding transcriptional MerR regulator